jgi:hypothetical protein
MSMVTIADVNQSNGLSMLLMLFCYQKVSFFLQLVLFEGPIYFIAGLFFKKNANLDIKLAFFS